MTFTEAFAKYGADLCNPQWSVSAFSPNGALVVSLYANWFKKGGEPRTLTYSDRLSGWKGNELGKNELQQLLRRAQEHQAPLRIVLAHPDPSQAHLVGQVADESFIKKTFSVREDWVGFIEHFDGDEYRFLIRQAP